MLDWRLLAVTVPLFFVSFQALSKLLPKTTSVFLVNAYASLVGVVIMLLLHFLTSSNKSIQLPAKYILISLGIGVLISLGNSGVIKAYSLGAPQSLFTPIFYIALIIYGIIVGLVIWREKMQLVQVLGVLLATAGLFIIFYFKK